MKKSKKSQKGVTSKDKNKGMGKEKEREKKSSSLESGSYNYKMFSFFNRKFKINEVEPPSDVNKAFSLFIDDGSTHMTAEQLRRFMSVHQCEVSTRLEDAQNIIEQVVNRRHHITKFARHTLNIEDFFYFLLSDDLNGPIRTQVHHDMSAPLSHYFIYTGHNSYLTGNQLSSDCSEVPIIKALQNGVRVIELDLWPSKDEILVLHGRTLTTPVSFIQCLTSIKEYAFVSSPYPVIITLEDHLTPELQAKAADMITQTFETMLYYPESDLTEFPSPESLKYRIMISTKPPKEYLEVRSKDASEDESSPKDDSDASESDQEDEDFKSLQAGVSGYKRLITIHAGKPKGSLKTALKEVTDQGYGKSLWLMHGMFRANGGCGYLIKPDILTRSADELFDPKATLLPVQKTLKIYIVGVPADEAKKKTKIIEDDWCPVWDEEFSFPLTVPELALLRIEVREYDMSEKDDFGGQTCLPVPELRTGFRSVPLHDKKGVKHKNVRLLMRGNPMSKQTYRVCFCFRRRFRVAVSEAPEEIKRVFEQYSEHGMMSIDGLHRFLVEFQKEDKATREDAQKIVDSVKHFHRKGLNLEGFFKYLFGDINPPLASLGVHHDMNAPLSHYFIHTGHNSYLTGNQLSSDCSDVPIINALKRGVRVIELDIWPNSTKDNVDVLHGRTLTTPVELIKCLKSIKEYAFVASEYPVVITLEDHLTPDLQAKVAEMVTQTFGDTLFSPGSECLKEFPSPESLKGRIIISTKPPKEYLEAKEVKENENDLERVKASDEEAWGKEVPDLLKDDYKNDLGEEDEEDPDDDGDKPQHALAAEYKRLIAIHAGKPKGGLEECLKVDPNKVRRLSMSEQQLEKAAITHGKEIVRFTQRNILRVYPRGTRVDSSNYNPLIGWMHGAQMVAFNMQGYGRSLWLMHGMFKANGGCGYLKKPDFLLNTKEVFDPNVKLPVKKILKVTMYMGEGWYYDFHHTHFDAYSPPDFYARVGIAGVPFDSVMKKTKTLEDNWVPCWNEEFEFRLTVPELALLRVEVHEYDMSEKDDFGGQTCLPISELRSGIRAVPLNSRKGKKYSSVKLLMRFEFVDP
ncbi:hypothetical protein CXB51_013641 [Gossypium anomalum]|uniref:Phosphoinositide phospholipase C n=1 Tax=Gossypium anomalum TaxID=47600 RepID=A0A8J6CZL9_9ROSI|nr:hypothetical protein CXB51_013641 [Gossypium anomalum]